ncbi:tumor necrosis factor a (TNF superfamily, member 2) [Esox lucius]|uniref:Lymphotoxin-alpha n=1 Tax=Esox lucius TaxID=8010 RepID=A0A3P8YR84_ESOLU|nr:tumor necrosis factor a (TNF superfamily, member 2) [Esox lucius]
METHNSSVMLDMDSGLVYRPTTVTLEREKSTRTNKWTLVGAVLAMSLCVAAALFFTFCAKNQDHIEETNEIQHTLRQLSGSGKDAIHLEGDYNAHGTYNTSVEWYDGVDQAFQQGDIKLENNGIVIPRNGLYFVYSQVSFRVSCQHKARSESELIHISHRVSRLTSAIGDQYNMDWRPLLHSLRTVCRTSAGSEGKWYSAVYMGAVFSLEKDDRLQTFTDNRILPQLESGPGKNVFGVFAL